jgi:Ubiquitin family
VKSSNDHDSDCNNQGRSSSSGSGSGSNGIRNNNDSNHSSDTSDYSNTWLCSECQNEKIEGDEEFSTQKAYRSQEISELCLLALYNTTRGRKKNKTRGMIRPPKKTADDKIESVPVRVVEDSSDAANSFALIDGIWLESWLDFMSDIAVDKPGPLCNTPLSCRHGQVLVPPYMVHILGDVSPADLKSAVGYEDTSCKGFPDMEIITIAQWRALLRIYSPSSSTMSKRRKIDHSSSVVTIDMSEDTGGDDGIDAVESDMSVTVTVSPPISCAISLNEEIEHKNGTTASIAVDSGSPLVFQVLISPPVPVPIPIPMGETDTEGVYFTGPKDGFWTWSPALCCVCREDVLARMNDIHLNFERYSFEIVIVPLEIEDMILEGDEDTDRDRDRDREKESKVVDAGNTRPNSSSASASTGTSTGGPSRRNPTRRRGSKSVKVLLSSTDSISLVKQKLAEKVEDSVCFGLGGHTLVYSGVHLTDHSKTLRDYNVRRDEVMQLHLSKSSISVDTLFGSTGNGKTDSYERGFGHNSFLTGTFPADPVASAQEPSRNKSSQEIVDQIMQVTGCTADQAKKTLTRYHGDVNDACEALLTS